MRKFLVNKQKALSSSLVLSLPDYLCSPDENIYNIDFTRFKIRDMETATVLFEITKPPSTGESEYCTTDETHLTVTDKLKPQRGDLSSESWGCTQEFETKNFIVLTRVKKKTYHVIMIDFA